MRSLTRVLERFLILKPSFMARLNVWRGQSTKLGSQKIAATSGIVLTMQACLYSRSSICYDLFNLIVGGHSQPAKLRSTSFLAWLLANGRVLIKVLSNFLSPIPLHRKRGENRGALGEKASSKLSFSFFRSTTLLKMPFCFFHFTHS